VRRRRRRARGPGAKACKGTTHRRKVIAPKAKQETTLHQTSTHPSSSASWPTRRSARRRRNSTAKTPGPRASGFDVGRVRGTPGATTEALRQQGRALPGTRRGGGTSATAQAFAEFLQRPRVGRAHRDSSGSLGRRSGASGDGGQAPVITTTQARPKEAWDRPPGSTCAQLEHG